VDGLDVVHQVSELNVFLVELERQDGDTVAQLASKRVHGVVHNNKIFHVTTLEYSQVFYVHVVCCRHAVLPIEPVLDEFTGGIHIVKNHISVVFVACREDDDLVELVCELQAFFRQRTNVESSLKDLSIL